jgi:hypothetical protein
LRSGQRWSCLPKDLYVWHLIGAQIVSAFIHIVHAIKLLDRCRARLGNLALCNVKKPLGRTPASPDWDGHDQETASLQDCNPRYPRKLHGCQAELKVRLHLHSGGGCQAGEAGTGNADLACHQGQPSVSSFRGRHPGDLERKGTKHDDEKLITHQRSVSLHDLGAALRTTLRTALRIVLLLLVCQNSL